MPLSTVLSKKTWKAVKIDVYQKLLLDRIDSYGSGDWKNGKIDGKSEIWSTSNSGTVISLNYRF